MVDFGLSHQLTSTDYNKTLTDKVGTFLFMSPEQLIL